jgi:hypothetical protein
VKEKIIGRIWFTPQGTTIGIVLVNDGFENKAYIGVGEGADSDEDEKYIASHGSPFPIHAAKMLMGGG